jgi:dihydrofolate synthase/folylpolyglutamate synthase
MAQALVEQGWLIAPDAIARGLARARWPGRLEIRSYRGQPLLLDGAHNPPAAIALRQELDLGDLDQAGLDQGDLEQGRAGPRDRGGRRWLLGIQRHKQGAAMLRSLLAPGDQAAITPLPEHASWSAADLAAACPELAPQLQQVAGPAAGLAWLHQLAGSGPGSGDQALSGGDSCPAPAAPLPVVAGSLYLLGALLPLLDSDPAGPG